MVISTLCKGETKKKGIRAYLKEDRDANDSVSLVQRLGEVGVELRVEAKELELKGREARNS